MMEQWTDRAPLLHPRSSGYAGHSSSDSGSIPQELVQAEVQRQIQRALEARDVELQELKKENLRLQRAAEARALEDREVPQSSAVPQGNPVNQSGPSAVRVHETEPHRPEVPPSQLPEQQSRASGLLGALGFVPQSSTVPRGNPVNQSGPANMVSEAAMSGSSYLPGSRMPGTTPQGPSTAPRAEHRDAGSTGEGRAGQPTSSTVDPLSVLVQGMAQLQQAMAGDKSKPEAVKPGVTGSELAKLPEMGETAALDVGDWLHALGGPMGDLSDTSSQWWQEVMATLERYYAGFLAASAVQKVSMKVLDYASADLLSARWTRLDKRACGMVLQAIPESVKKEVLANRLTTTLEVLARIVTLHRPGSATERQQILKALSEPGAATTPLEVVDSLRRWARWLKRSRDLGLQAPDASILLKGLDQAVKRVNESQPEVSFRLNLVRYTLDLDASPTLDAVEKYHSNLLGEYEQLAYRGRNKQPPVLKGISSEGSPKSGTDGGESPKKEGKIPCKFFSSEFGCKKGKACSFQHEFVDKKDRTSRCWTCGAKQHRGKDCPRQEGRAPAAKPKGQPTKPTEHNATSSTATPSMATLTTATAGVPSEPAASSTGHGGSDTPSVVLGEPVGSDGIKELMEQAQAMLKEMRQLKMMVKPMSPPAFTVEGLRELRDGLPGRAGLLDSGASHPFRAATDEELSGAETVSVQLADGGMVTLKQARNGTLFPTKTTSTTMPSPIVPLGALVEVLGCRVSWTKKHGTVVTHPEWGPIKTSVVGSCPTVSEAQALTLIKQLEDKKLEDLKRRTSEGKKSLKGMENGNNFKKYLKDYVSQGQRTSLLAAINADDSIYKGVPETIKSSLAEEINISDKAGWNYLAALPVNRRTRKRMMTARWVVRICNKGIKGTPVEYKLLEGPDVVVINLDSELSKSLNLKRVAGVYRALLWGAATNRIEGIIGGPSKWSNYRDELMLKQMMVWEVAKEAATRVYAPAPYFEARLSEGGEELLGTEGVWDDFAASNMMERIAGQIQGAATKGLTSLPLEEVCANDGDLVNAVLEWRKQPPTCRLRAMRGPRRFADMSDKQLEYWKEHVRSGHMRYDRRCQTCVMASATGRQHKRVETPSAYVISYDVIGPLKECGEDIDYNDYRYALVAAYTYPKDLVKLKEESSEEQKDDEFFPPEIEEEEEEPEGGLRGLFEEDLEQEPDLEGEDEDEARRSANTVSDEEYAKLFVEVGHGLEYETRYYVRPMRTRMAREVHPLVKEIYLEVRAEGFPVARAHADRARELRHQELKQWFADRDVLMSFTEGQAPQANGRAEAAVKKLKGWARRLLYSAKLPASCWYLAMNYSAWVHRLRLDGREHEALPFGAEVMVKKKRYTKEPWRFDPKWGPGVYVGPATDVHGGSLVRFAGGYFVVSTHLREGLLQPEEFVDKAVFEVENPAPERRVKGKTKQTEMQEDDDEPVHEAEVYANRVLTAGRHIMPEDIEMLMEMLPTMTQPRETDVEGKTWSTGAFVHGGVAGLRVPTRKFPETTRLLAQYVRQTLPDHKFSSVCLSLNNKVNYHRDVNNSGLTAVMPISEFEGGEVWIEEEGGDDIEHYKDKERRGRLHRVEDGPVIFDPKKNHLVKNWTGERLVLIAYGIREPWRLVPRDREQLDALDFNLDEEACEGPALRAIGKDGHSQVPGEGTFIRQLQETVVELNMVIEDMQHRERALKLLLEEEEALGEQLKRARGVVQDDLQGLQGQITGFLTTVGTHLEEARTARDVHLMAIALEPESEVNYEEMIANLKVPLEVVHTVPLGQVKENIAKWRGAIAKEIQALFASGTLRAIPDHEARLLEEKGLLKTVPAKGIFTLKPPSSSSEMCRRKCRIVLCGNHVSADQTTMDVYAGGTSAEAVRIALSVAGSRKWAAAISDITSAFLLAEWPKDLPKYGIKAPKVVQNAGFHEECDGKTWIVDRPLYGLRESPALWSDYRNKRFRAARIRFKDQHLRLEQLVSEPDVWRVLDEQNRLVGLAVTYVDDFLYLGEPDVIKAVDSWVREEWPASPLEWVNGDEPSRYLGMELWLRDGKYMIGQGGYIRDLLRSHEMTDVRAMYTHVPREWLDGDYDVQEEYSEEELRCSQRQVGELLWLTSRSRPDIQYVVGWMSSSVTRRPRRVSQVATRLLAYVAGTAEMKLVVGQPRSGQTPVSIGHLERYSMPGAKKLDGEVEGALRLQVFSDASFAPHGERSYGASVFTVNDCVVTWKAGKQSFATVSVAEAELFAGSEAVVLAESAGSVIDEILAVATQRHLHVDNAAAEGLLGAGPGSWRTRHLKVRCAGVRDMVVAGALTVGHTPGHSQLADLGTKVHGQDRLRQLLLLWNFVDIPESGGTRQRQACMMKLLCLLLVIQIGETTAMEDEGDDAVAYYGLQPELTFVGLLLVVAAVAVWEGLKWIAGFVFEDRLEQRQSRRLQRLQDRARRAAEQAVEEGLSERSNQGYKQPPPVPRQQPEGARSRRWEDRGVQTDPLESDFRGFVGPFFMTQHRETVHTHEFCEGLRNRSLNRGLCRARYCNFCITDRTLFMHGSQHPEYQPPPTPSASSTRSTPIEVQARRLGLSRSG